MQMASLMTMAMVALTGCATTAAGSAGAAPARNDSFSVVTVSNRTSVDVCGLYVWSDGDDSRRSDNRLLPGTVLVGRTSDYRMPAGSWRDVVIAGDVDATFHLEARDCDGRVVTAWHRDQVATHDGVFQITRR